MSNVPMPPGQTPMPLAVNLQTGPQPTPQFLLLLFLAILRRLGLLPAAPGDDQYTTIDAARQASGGHIATFPLADQTAAYAKLIQVYANVSTNNVILVV